MKGLIAIHREPTDVVVGRHLEAMYRLDERSMALSAELRAGRWNTDRLRTLMQELGEIVAEDFDRTLGPLKAARELILLRGRFRFQLPPVNIT